MSGWQTLGRAAVAVAVFLVAVSLGALAYERGSRVVGLDPVGLDPEPSDTSTPVPSVTPTGHVPGCDPRADRRLRRADVEVATTVRYVVGVAARDATVPPSPRPLPFAVAYPAVTSGPPAAVARRISADLRRRAITAIADASQTPPKPAAAPPGATPQPSLDSAPDRLLGVRVDAEIPGAKSMRSLAWTYDLTTGARVVLADLFPAGRDCEPSLCRAIGARLVETLGRDSLLDPDRADAAMAGQTRECPYLERASDGRFDQAFMVEPDGLALLFGACQIVPCASGPIVMTVPFGAI
jgi:hypothetical protein